MKIKQIKLFILASLVIVSSASGLVLSGVVTGNQTAKAYVCPGKGDADEPLYNYHESDGKCWKIDYKKTSQTPPVAKLDPNTHVYACPDGTDPKSGSGGNQCKLTCAAGDIYHSDNNSCYNWNQKDYILDETQRVEPTTNDNKPLNGTNGHCTDGFQWVEKGGKDNAGCYNIVNGGPQCGKDQVATVSRSSDGQNSYNCSESGHTHLVPNDPKQSADTSKPPVNNGNGQNQTHCTDGSTPDANNKCANGAAPVAGANPGTGANPDNSLTNCGEAQTVLIKCDPDARGTTVIGTVLKYILAALTVLIGIAAVGGIVWESLQYARAQDDASIISSARNRIRDIVIGLFVYVFMVAIVNWLVPGGILP